MINPTRNHLENFVESFRNKNKKSLVLQEPFEQIWHDLKLEDYETQRLPTSVHAHQHNEKFLPCRIQKLDYNYIWIFYFSKFYDVRKITELYNEL